MALIDAFAAGSLFGLRQAVAEAYAKFAKTRKMVEELKRNAAEKERTLDFLQYQIAEIQRAALKPREEEELLLEKARIQNAEKIALHLSEAKEALSGAEGAVPRLYAAVHALLGIAKLDVRYEKLAGTLNDTYYSVEEASYDLSSLCEDVLFDEARLEEVEDRLAVISALKRKYGGSCEEVLEFLENAQQQLEQLEHSEVRLEELEAQLKKQESELDALCSRLTQQRKSCAEKLTEQLFGDLLCQFLCAAFALLRQPAAQGVQLALLLFKLRLQLFQAHFAMLQLLQLLLRIFQKLQYLFTAAAIFALERGNDSQPIFYLLQAGLVKKHIFAERR